MPLKIAGHTYKDWQVAAVAVGGIAVTWYAVKQHQAAGQSASGSSDSATAIDPVTGLPYDQDDQDDPLTGMTYLGEAEEYGSVQAAENAVAEQSALDYSTAYGTGSSVAGTADTAVTTAAAGATYASNTAWEAACVAGLTDLGYSAGDIQAALGRYLASLPETSDQAAITQTALAEYGPPPDGSYTIVLASPTTTAAAGSTSGSSDAGSSAGTSTAAGTSAAASASAAPSKPPATAPDPVTYSTTSNDLNISFPPVGGATQYGYSFANGHTAATTATAGVFSVATVGGSGSFRVRAGNAAGWGPWGAPKSYSFPSKG